MRHLISLTQAIDGGTPIFVMPANIKGVEPQSLYTVVYCGGEDQWRVIESPEEIDMKIDLLKIKQDDSPSD